MKVACPVGYYSFEGQSLCSACSAGFICTGTGNTTPSPVSKECPLGNYCPIGAFGISESLACPIGTFQVFLAKTSISDCLPCPAGYLCDDPASALPAAPDCTSGFYCPGISSTKNWYDLLQGADSFNPINPDSVRVLEVKYPCPAGSYSATTGLSLESQCTECPGIFQNIDFIIKL